MGIDISPDATLGPGEVMASGTLTADKVVLGNGGSSVKVSTVGDAQLQIMATSANTLADNVLIRGDGGARGVQGSGVQLADDNSLIGVNNITCSQITSTTLNPEQAVVSDASRNMVSSPTTAAELAFLSGVTSAVQTQLDDKQPLDADLTAVADLNSLGLLVRDAPGSIVTRTIVDATNGGILITNGNGVGDNPAVALDISDLAFTPCLPTGPPADPDICLVDPFGAVPFRKSSVDSPTEKTTLYSIWTTFQAFYSALSYFPPTTGGPPWPTQDDEIIVSNVTPATDYRTYVKTSGITITSLQSSIAAANNITHTTPTTPYRRVTLSNGTAAQDVVIESYINRLTTTDNTATPFPAYTLSANKAYTLICEVTGRRTGGASGNAGDQSEFKITASVRLISGVATLLATPDKRTFGESNVATDVNILVSGATVYLSVTGVTSNNYTWSSRDELEITGD